MISKCSKNNISYPSKNNCIIKLPWGISTSQTKLTNDLVFGLFISQTINQREIIALIGDLIY